MSKTQREAAFRGTVVQSEMGTTQKPKCLPQFILRMACAEIYDPDTKEFVANEDDGEFADAYLCLFKENGDEIFWVDTVKKLFGWSGESFAELATLDLSKVTVTFRTEWQEYNDKQTLKVVWLGDENADPERELTGLNSTELKDLDSKWGGKLKKKKAATATKGKPTTAKDETPAKTEKPGPPSKPKNTAPPKPTAAKDIPDPTPVPETCDSDGAWEIVSTFIEANFPDTTEDRITKDWMEAIKGIAGDTEPDAIADDIWPKIATQAMELLTLPI